tara:strand:+ start:2066 stop:2755 length:690 start_codon:yes stop_codon:yes gene_type:complete
MQKTIWLILAVTVFLFSCSKDEEEFVEPYLGHDYAGLEIGKYVIYDVDSFFYDDFNGLIDSSFYQVKEVVESKITDLEGDEAFKIIRYRKESDTTGWVLIDVWSSKLSTTNFQKVEENVRFLKLIFPINLSDTWNGNALNNEGEQLYDYTAVEQSETIGGNALSNVLTVLQFEEINLIEEKIFEEKYAKGIGMVYKKTVDITKVYNSSNGLFERSLGLDITMTLSSFGG